jgi:hypothetical protein
MMRLGYNINTLHGVSLGFVLKTKNMQSSKKTFHVSKYRTACYHVMK